MAKLNEDKRYVSIDEAIRDLKELGAFGSPVSENILKTITGGKDAGQSASIRTAAGFSIEDIGTLEAIVADLKVLGFGVNINGSARDNSISIVGTLDNQQQFNMTIGLDDDGTVVINGMPSANGLVAKLYHGNQDLGLTTLSSARLTKFEESLRSNYTLNKFQNPNTTTRQKAGFVKWLDRQAREQTLGLGSSRAQMSVFKDVQETMRKAGTNHYRSQWQNGLIYLDDLYEQFKSIDNMLQGPQHTQSQRDKSNGKLDSQLQLIEELYLTAKKPEDARRIILSDSSFKNITSSRAWSVIDRVFSQMNGWGMHQGTLSENGAAKHIAALNNLGRYGEAYQSKVSRKMVQTNLTALGSAKVTPNNRSIFSTPRGASGSDGNFRLYTRAFVTDQNILDAYNELRKEKMSGSHPMTKKQFEDMYGRGLESVAVDALLYRGGPNGVGADFHRVDRRNDKISKSAMAKALIAQGVDLSGVMGTNGQIDWNKALASESVRARMGSIARGLSKKYSKDAKTHSNSRDITFDRNFDNDDFLGIQYDRTSRFAQGKLVAPSGTYRESANAINSELFDRILRKAGYTGVKDLSSISFLANATTGSKVKYGGSDNHLITSVESKGIGDYVVGYFNHIARQYVNHMQGQPGAGGRILTREDAVEQFYNTIFGENSNFAKSIPAEDFNAIKALFSVAGDKSSIVWGTNPTSDHVLRQHTIDLMYALGALDPDNGGENPFRISKDKRRLELLRPILLEHEEAIHQPFAYGGALRGQGGYNLAQGYRERDSALRMLMESVRGESSGSAAFHNADLAKRYVNAMYAGQTEIGSEEYNRIQKAVRTLNEQAFDPSLTEDRVRQMYRSAKGPQALVIDVAKALSDEGQRIGDKNFKFKPGFIEHGLEYNGPFVTKESFNETNLKILEDMIAASGLQNPQLYLKLPNGNFYSTETDKGLAVGNIVPLFYRSSSTPRGGDEGYMLSPEASGVMSLLNRAIEYGMLGDVGPDTASDFGRLYRKYQEALNQDVFLKDGSTYSKAHSVAIAHAIMPATVGRQAGAYGSALDNALTLSAEDVEEMLKTTHAEREMYFGKNRGKGPDGKPLSPDYGGFARDVLSPIYSDLFGHDFSFAEGSAEQKEYNDILAGGKIIKKDKTTGAVTRRGAKNGAYDAAMYKEAIMRKQIMDAMTIGTDAFEATNYRGILGAMNRYPSSNGKDIRAAKLLIDPSLTSGKMGGDQSLFDLVNADYDGDHGVVRLWYADGTVISQQIPGLVSGDSDFASLSDEQKKARFGQAMMAAGRQAFDYQLQVNEVYRKIKADEALASISDPSSRVADEDASFLGEITAEEIDSLDAADAEQKEFLKHHNKEYTGISSNLYQAITQAMFNRHLDEASPNFSTNATGVSASIIRAFEESFTQNAISSKKVKKTPEGLQDLVSWWKGVDQAYELLSSGETYSVGGEGKFHDLYERLVSLDVLKDAKLKTNVTGALVPRIAASVLGMVNGQDATGKNLESLKYIFGSQFTEDNFVDKETGKVKNAHQLKFDEGVFWRAFQHMNTAAGDGRFIEKAIKDKYKLVPGIGGTLLNLFKTPSGVLDEDALRDAGFVVKDGVITAQLDIRATPNTRQAISEIRSGASSLIDFAKRMPSFESQMEILERVAGKGLGKEHPYSMSPTRLVGGMFGGEYQNFDTREETSLFDQKFKKYVKGEGTDHVGAPVNMYTEPDARYWGFTKDSFFKMANNKVSTLRGTYVHGIAELYGDIFSKYAPELFGEQDDNLAILKSLYTDEDLKKLGLITDTKTTLSTADVKILADNLDLAQLTKYLGAKGHDIAPYADRMNELIKARSDLEGMLYAMALPSDISGGALVEGSSGARTLSNAELAGRAQHMGFRHKMMSGGGGILATELPLYGISGNGGDYDLMYGKTDIVGYTIGDNGNLVYHYNDYKNTNAGKSTPEHFMQVTPYGRAGNMLLEDFLQSNAPDFASYLSAGSSNLAKLYGELIKNNPDLLEKYEGFVSPALKHRGETIGTHLSVSNVGVNNGEYSMSDMDYGTTRYQKDYIRALLQIADESGGMPLSEEMLSSVGRLVQEHSVNAGAQPIAGYQTGETAKSDLEVALEELPEIYKLKYKIFVLDQKIAQYESKGQAFEAEQLREKRGGLEETLKGKEKAQKDRASLLFGNDESAYKDKIAAWEVLFGNQKEGYQQHVADAEAAQYLSQYKTLMRQRTQLQTSIYGDNLRANTVVGAAQRGAYADRAAFSQDQLTEIEEAIANLLQHMEGNESFSKGKQEIDDKMSVLLQKGQLNAMVQNRGVSSIWGAIGSQFQRTFQYFMNFGAVTKVIQGTMTTIKKVIGYAEQLDKSLTNIRIVTGKSAEEVSDMMNGYADLAEDLAVSTSDVANSASEWLRQGYNVAEVNDLVTSTMYLSKLGMIDTESALKNLTSTMKGFKLEASDSMDIVDKLTTLDINAATTAGEIANALSEFSNTASMAGVNLDQAAAMATTIMDVSQVSGSTAGTSLKTIISRYGNVKAGAYTSMSDSESDDTTDNLNDVEKVLRKVGVSIRDSKNEFRDFDDVLQDLGDIWDTLDSVSQNAIATAFAGRQALCLNV